MFGDSTSSEAEILQPQSRPSSVLWLEKPYTTSELLQILKFSQGLDFSKINLAESLSNDEPNQLLINILIVNNKRASLSIDPEKFPTLLSKLIIQGFRKWDYFKLENTLAVEGWRDFQNQLLALFRTGKEDKTQLFHDFLSHESYKAPDFVNAMEFQLVHFIASLTNLQCYEQAKVIHDFIHFCKMIVRDDPVKKQTYLSIFVSSFLEGLNLTSANPERIAFMECIFNAALNHPIFLLPYDEHIYDILYQLRDIPNLVYRDLYTPLTSIQYKHYQDVCHNLNGQSVLNYFTQMVSLTCTFHHQELARDMHNTLVRLRELYRLDAPTPDKNVKYGKVLRILFRLPSPYPALDKRFDEIAVNMLFENQDHKFFNKQFKVTKYIKSIDQSIYNRYCMELQERLNDAESTIIKQDKVTEEQTQKTASQSDTINEQVETIAKLTRKLEKQSQSLAKMSEKSEILEKKLGKKQVKLAHLESKFEELAVKDEGKHRVLTFLHNHAASSPPFMRQRSLSDGRLKPKNKK